jgi:hypothetical protein
MIETLNWLWVIGGFTTAAWFVVLCSTREGTADDLPAFNDETGRSRQPCR